MSEERFRGLDLLEDVGVDDRWDARIDQRSELARDAKSVVDAWVRGFDYSNPRHDGYGEKEFRGAVQDQLTDFYCDIFSVMDEAGYGRIEDWAGDPPEESALFPSEDHPAAWNFRDPERDAADQTVYATAAHFADRAVDAVYEGDLDLEDGVAYSPPER